jgi:hypothetical protein
MLLSIGQPAHDDYSPSARRTTCVPAARATLTHGAEHDSSIGWGNRYQSADGALCIIGQGTTDISVGEGRNYSLAGSLFICEKRMYSPIAICPACSAALAAVKSCVARKISSVCAKSPAPKIPTPIR